MTTPDPKAGAPGAATSQPSETEIAVLEALTGEGASLVARLPSGVTAFRTQLLFVDPQRRYLLIRASDDSAATASLLASRHANLLALHGEWRIEFTAGSPRPDAHEGHRAVRLAFPRSVAITRRRLQERVPVPQQSALRCYGPAAGPFHGAVTDVSEGGIGVLQDFSASPPLPGARLVGCRLERPGRQPVGVDLEVRYTEPVPLPGGRPGMKVGYRLLEPSPEALALVSEFLRPGS